MDQYCILGRIGEGAHGIVFKAKHVEVSGAVGSPPAAVPGRGTLPPTPRHRFPCPRVHRCACLLAPLRGVRPPLWPPSVGAVRVASFPPTREATAAMPRVPDERGLKAS